MSRQLRGPIVADARLSWPVHFHIFRLRFAKKTKAAIEDSPAAQQNNQARLPYHVLPDPVRFPTGVFCDG
jgi:hypothetical protein